MLNANTGSDTITWQVLQAADNATCALYAQIYDSSHSLASNVQWKVKYSAGETNTWDAVIVLNVHGGTAEVRVACWLGAETLENKRWAWDGERVITIE